MNQPDSEEMRDEYDFSGGVRGKHFRTYREGTNLIPLDRDLVATFPDAAAVNQALRLLAQLAKKQASSRGPAEPEAPASRSKKKRAAR